MNPDPSSLTNDFLNALQQHNWPVAVGFVIVFLIYGANRMGLDKKINPKFIPALSIVLGLLSAIGAQLVLGISWTEAITKGFLAGATATGLWETALKHVLPKSLDVAALSTTAASAEAPVVAPKAVRKSKKVAETAVAETAPVVASDAAVTAVMPDAPAAATVKERKKPGPKPGSKKVKAEAAPEAVAATPGVPPAA